VISAVVGMGAAAAGLVYLGSPWIAVLFGSATVGAVRQARKIWLFGADSKQGLDAELGRARAAVARGDANVALAVAEEVLGRARTSPMRNGAVLALAWAQATLGRPLVARELLERLERDGPVDAFLLAAVEDALGSPEAARARLEAAHREGMKDADATKLLIDLYAREGKLTRAIEVAMQELEVLGREAAAAVLSEAMARGAYAPAADLAARMFEVFGDPADAVTGARAAALAGKRAPL
jgi:tetratricopeptide (TPR) repeat protein